MFLELNNLSFISSKVGHSIFKFFINRFGFHRVLKKFLKVETWDNFFAFFQNVINKVQFLLEIIIARIKSNDFLELFFIEFFLRSTLPGCSLYVILNNLTSFCHKESM